MRIGEIEIILKWSDDYFCRKEGDHRCYQKREDDKFETVKLSLFTGTNNDKLSFAKITGSKIRQVNIRTYSHPNFQKVKNQLLIHFRTTVFKRCQS